MHKILGQVDIVGVPFTLGSTLFQGVSSLVVAPSKARSPVEFFDSIGQGLFILFRNAAYGVFHAFGQVQGPFLPVLSVSAHLNAWEILGMSLQCFGPVML
jgi:hypothetical protein